jgi:hypothetical protein
LTPTCNGCTDTTAHVYIDGQPFYPVCARCLLKARRWEWLWFVLGALVGSSLGMCLGILLELVKR